MIDLVNNIIRHRINNEALIEHTLDRILDLLLIDEDNRSELFFKLNDYYRLINKKASDDYSLIYLELYMENRRE